MGSLTCWQRSIIGFSTIAGICIYSSIKNIGEFNRGEAWTAPGDWRSTRCEVLSVGVACRETVFGGACLDIGASGSTLKKASSGAIVFDTSDLAVCPGTHWCSSEGNTCKCDGTVDFATSLSDGLDYTVSDSDSEFRVRSSGAIQCSTVDKGGPFLQDPAPGSTKQCWCTPDAILRQLHRGGDSSGPLDRRQCAKEANADYLGAATSAEVPAALALHGVGIVPPAGRRGSLGLHAASFGNGDDNSTENADEHNSGDPRAGFQLTVAHYQKNYMFSPWALVKVLPDDSGDVFGSADDVFSSHSPKMPSIRCAYPYGSPAASDYMWSASARPLVKHPGGDTAAVEELVGSWANAGTTACYVRDVGRSGDDVCAVALEPLDGLVATRRYGLLISVTIAVCSSGIVIFLTRPAGVAFCNRVSARERREGAPGSQFVDPLLGGAGA